MKLPPPRSGEPSPLQTFVLLGGAALTVPVYRTAGRIARAVLFLRGSPRLMKAAHLTVLVLSWMAISAGVLVSWCFVGGEPPSLDTLLTDTPPTIGRIADARGEVLAELALEYRRPFDHAEVPLVLRRALLAAEDKNFFEHRGVDWSAMPRVVAKAVAASVRRHRVVLPQGGSTLTMQLVRMVYLPEWTASEQQPVVQGNSWTYRALGGVVGAKNANKLRRKVEEIRLSLWLEAALERQLGSVERAKEEILRRYAAYIYLGEGRYGFAAASEHYLGRPLRTLGSRDAGIAALLAGIPKYPGHYAPTAANQDECSRRRNHVLTLMAERGYITEAEATRYGGQPIPRVAGWNPGAPSAPAAVNTVFGVMRASGDPRVSSLALFEGRIAVEATVDGRVQEMLNEALEDGLKAYETRHPGARGVIQGSAVVLANNDARILALAGGRQRFHEKPTAFTDLNRVTESHRQPGSAMKPLVYLAAFRQGADLNSEVLDAPIAVTMGVGRPPKWINNYDGQFRGPITLRQALAESRNAATLRVVEAVGVGAVLDVARELGVHSKLQPYPTVGLGASEVTLLELANVYRTIASGTHAEPWIVRRITAADGLEIYGHYEPPREKMELAGLAEVQEGLRGVIRLPSATGHSLASLKIPVMGKTGTTNDYRDALFVGSTFGPSGITVAVRVGFDDNRTLGKGETGGRVALPVFRDLVTSIYKSGVLGPAPAFPSEMEADIDAYLVAAASAPGVLTVDALENPGPNPGAVQTAASTAPPAAVTAPPVAAAALPVGRTSLSIPALAVSVGTRPISGAVQPIHFTDTPGETRR